VKKAVMSYPNETGLRVTGQVIVRIEVDRLGKVITTDAICGHALLRAGAEAAARKFEFPPR
jgi:hypothetical protein